MKKIITGSVLIIIGIVAAIFWLNTNNMAIGFLALFLPAGISIIYYSIKGKSLSFSGINFLNNKPEAKTINSFNFYASGLEDSKAKAVICKPEHIDNPSGIPFKSRRWKDKFYINVNIPENGNIEVTKLQPITDVLSDCKYHDPRTLVKAAFLPANTELAKHVNDNIHKMSTWVLVLIIGIEIIGLIIIP